MQTARGLFKYQVPGATKSLGGLARPQAGGKPFYRVEGSTKQFTEADA